MTVLCGGGSSEPQAGVDGAIAIGTGAVEAFLTAAGFGAFAPLISGFVAASAVIDAASYCGTDPPADPGVTAGDLADAINFASPEISIPAQAKFVTWFLSQYWSSICQCNSGTVPVLPAPSNPGGATSSPGLPSGTSSAICWSGAYSSGGSEVHDTGSTSAVWVDMNDLLPGDATVTISPTALFSTLPFDQAKLLPATVVDMTLTATGYGDYGPGIPEIYIWWFNSSGTPLTGPFELPLTNTTATHVQIKASVPAGAYSWIAFGYIGCSPNPPGTYTMSVSFTYECGAGNTPQSACCMPGPASDSSNQQILGLLNAIYTAITSLPTAPASYATATVHSGLSGDGTITFSDDAIALLATITTDMPAYGQSDGEPPFLFGRGYIVPFTSLGPVRDRTRLAYGTQVFSLPLLSESVGYSFPAGLVVSLTELVAGP
jgi:hypothetical protein